MGGIAGYARLDGARARAERVDSLSKGLTRRGSRESRWQEGHVALVARNSRQSSLGMAVSHRKDLALVGDVRIDNRKELQQTCNGLADVGLTDESLLIDAYGRWGVDCVKRIAGDFSFALWDAEEGHLYCARDPVGVRPFYYCYLPGEFFAFASTTEALLLLPEVPDDLDECRVADYLDGVFLDEVSTFYRSVRRLPRGHTLLVSSDSIAVHPYWTPDSVLPWNNATDAHYAEAFDATFREAVRCRLPTNRKVGALLSGGLDSSAVVCVARELCSSDLATFSAVFDDVWQTDERGFIRVVLEGGRLQPNWIRGDITSPFAHFDQAYRVHNEPFYGPNDFLNWALFESAARAGVEILLDGMDGDTVVSHGIGRLPELLMRGRWFKLRDEIDGVSELLQMKPWDVLRTRVLSPILPSFARSTRNFLRGNGSRLVRRSMLRHEFAKRCGTWDRAEIERARLVGLATGRLDHLARFGQGIFPFLLEVLDRDASAFALDLRHPFLDKRVIDLCLSIPASQKLDGGKSRVVVRRALHDVLPVAVRERRTKSDASHNFLRSLWILERDFLAATVRTLPACMQDYVDPSAVERVLGRYFRARGQSAGDAMILWRVSTLAMWFTHKRYGTVRAHPSSRPDAN